MRFLLHHITVACLKYFEEYKYMKKYMPGFVPVNFNQVGKILLIIGLACLITKLFSFLTGWFIFSDYSIYFGAGLILLGLYLIFIVPKE